MSWPRESLLLVILALSAPWACADTLTVNTRTDDFAGNSLCSLREAVEYFNRGQPEDGFQGCRAEFPDGSAVIKLPADASPYLIQGSSITIGVPLRIEGEGRRPGLVTTLQVMGAHRAFVVNHNPQYVPPACAQAPVTCASNAARFNLVATSDTDTVGDYLTSNPSPYVEGSMPGVVPVPPETDVPPHSYLVRVYANPEEGDPVEVGRTKVAMSTSDMPWEARLNFGVEGVHHLTYTRQEINTLSNVAIGEESAPLPESLKVAVFAIPGRIGVSLTQMIIKGGCATATDCAPSANDNTVVTNDPLGAGYDEYALSYTSGLTGTEGNGGVFFSNEYLFLTDVLVGDGAAERGGAIFLTADGGLFLDKSEIRTSRADQGAALYSAYNAVELSDSLLTGNVLNTPAGSGAVVEVAASTVPSGLPASRLTNVTISGNTGLALSLRAGTVVNASTIVLNSGGGLDFNGEDVAVYNTILAANPDSALADDCRNLPVVPAVPVGPVMLRNLVLSAGSCPVSGNQSIANTPGDESQLMATLVGGKCLSPFGLLCPLADHAGPTFVHMPRVLESYDDDALLIGASPIINKGSTKVGASDIDSCPSNDQRGKERVVFACDIGAVELQAVATGSQIATGGVIGYGGLYSQYLGDDLADEVLLSLGKCPAAVTLTLGSAPAAVFPPPLLAPDPTVVVPDSYQQGVPGCPWLEKAPDRGVVAFTAGGNYTYRPSSDFHGFDRFYIRVVTTISILNTHPSDRSRLLRAVVIVEPSSVMTSSKLSGALDAWSILLLAALGLGWRRGGKV